MFAATIRGYYFAGNPDLAQCRFDQVINPSRLPALLDERHQLARHSCFDTTETRAYIKYMERQYLVIYPPVFPLNAD